MSKYCGNCGAKLDDNARVCGQCGIPLHGAPSKIPGVKADTSERQKKVKKTLKRIVALIAIVIALAIAINIAFNFTGYRGLLRKVMHAYAGYDIDTLVSLSSDMYYYGTEEYAEYYFENVAGRNLDYYENSVGHNFKLSYDISETYTLSGRKLDEMLDNISGTYPNFDVGTIQKIRVICVDVTAKQGQKSTRSELQVTLSKESGSWKLLFMN